MENIEREISFSIGEKKFFVKFPNVGQMIDMEALKQALTSNRYGAMCTSGVKSMYLILDQVDAIAFYQICVPSVAKYYNINNFASLQPDEISDLVDNYIRVIKPWYDRVLKQIYTHNAEPETEGNKSENEG